MTETNLIRKLRALLEMSRRGTEREKAIASDLLSKLLIKHKLTIGDIDPENKGKYYFSYRTKFEKNLLFQIIYFVTNNENINYYQIKGKTEMGFMLTRAEYIEIDRLYRFWKKELAKELERCFAAFIHANKIYGNGVKGNPEDMNELRNILEMADTIKSKRPYHQLKPAHMQEL